MKFESRERRERECLSSPLRWREFSGKSSGKISERHENILTLSF
jgi:hypothetical protein